MFCTNCGAELPDTVQFCQQCGGDVSLPPVSDPATRAALGLPVHRVRTLSFHGNGGELFKLYLVNGILAIVTAGVYWFWGKAKVRRYVFGQVQFDSERFQFHGTGLEMFKGWVKAASLLIAAYAAAFGIIAAMGAGRLRPITVQLTLVLVISAFTLFAIPFAIAGTWRYRVSRTSWRGIRFSFTGGGREFMGIWVKGVLLTVSTLGLYLPFFLNETRRYLFNHTRFGTLRFSYAGQGDQLFPRFLISYCLILVTFGLYRFWWSAELDRFYWQHTTLGPMRFRSTYDGGGLMVLNIINGILIILTLGIATPWAIARTLEYRFANLVAEGELDYAAIQQQMQGASATGEGLADMLDLDADLGF